MEARVLLIEGMSVASNWYSEAVLGGKETTSSEERAALRRVWASLGGVRRVDFDYGTNAAGVQAAIRRGGLAAIIACDLSENEARLEFESHLGPLVAEFARRGGYVLFPTSEGLLLQSTLQAVFETPWVRSSYYRTEWGVPPERASRVDELFGEAPRTFSAKACSIRGAGADACYGVTTSSRHQSLSMQMMGYLDASRKDATSVTAPEGLEEDFDVAVAVRDFGDGKVAFFGDVNAEYATCAQIAALCRHAVERAPPSPPLVDLVVLDRLALPPPDFDRVVALKARGNDAFHRHAFADALACYRDALRLYADKPGSAGAQRGDKVKLLSNSAECHLRLRDFPAAEAAAQAALDLDQSCTKARLRRVKAVAFRLERRPPPDDPDEPTHDDDRDDLLDELADELDQVRFELGAGHRDPTRRSPAGRLADLDDLHRRIDRLRIHPAPPSPFLHDASHTPPATDA